MRARSEGCTASFARSCSLCTAAHIVSIILARQSLARQLSASCEHGKEVPLLLYCFASRDLDVCLSRTSSDLIVEQSRERHQVRIFCIHVPPTDTFVCTCLLEFKTAATASWIFVLLCVMLHAHVCFSDCVPCNSCHQYKCICAVLCCAMLCYAVIYSSVLLCNNCCLFLDTLDLSYTITRFTVLQSLQRLLPLCHL